MGGMHERTVREILLLDVGGGIAEVEAVELAGVSLTQSDELRMGTPEAKRLLDICNRDDARRAVCKRVAGHGEGAEDVNDHGDAPGCTCACLEIQKLNSGRPSGHGQSDPGHCARALALRLCATRFRMRSGASDIADNAGKKAYSSSIMNCRSAP